MTRVDCFDVVGNHNHTVYKKWRKSENCSVVSNSLRPHGLYSPWNSPGQNTGVGSCSLLQGIFPTQRSNSGLPHCRQILYQLRHKGSPRILGWVAYPFSCGSSQPRNRTGVSCITGGFFTNWAIREAPFLNCIEITCLCVSSVLVVQHTRQPIDMNQPLSKQMLYFSSSYFLFTCA